MIIRMWILYGPELIALPLVLFDRRMRASRRRPWATSVRLSSARLFSQKRAIHEFLSEGLLAKRPTPTWQVGDRPNVFGLS
jgi:hypothetical protein